MPDDAAEKLSEAVRREQAQRDAAKRVADQLAAETEAERRERLDASHGESPA